MKERLNILIVRFAFASGIPGECCHHLKHVKRDNVLESIQRQEVDG